MAEQAMYFHIELCSARANTGTTGSSMPGHCDHQTRETRGEIGIESRDWRCCYCGREWTEEVKPLPKIPTVFVAQPHGPFAPQTFIMNAAARERGDIELTARKKAKKAAKKPGSRAGQTPTLVRMPNGGALWAGPARNPVAGTGRPPDEIRAKLRELGATKSVPFLSDLLDGKVSVSLLGKCDACAHEQEINAEWIELVMERIKASNDQRLKASEQTLKHGLATKELVIASTDAAAFFDCVHTAVLELGGPEMAERVKARAIQLVEAKA